MKYSNEPIRVDVTAKVDPRQERPLCLTVSDNGIAVIYGGIDATGGLLTIRIVATAPTREGQRRRDHRHPPAAAHRAGSPCR